MMTLANYGLRSNQDKDPTSAKALNKSFQVRNKAETLLKQCIKSYYHIPVDKRNEILDITRDYYRRVPFDLLIWNHDEVKQCIVDSILLLDIRFDPYKAAAAFNKVEEMLVNLVKLPWHEEFRRIYTYSGQFRMVVSDPLFGVEDVLAAAGYTSDTSDNQPMHLYLPDSKMPQKDDGKSITGLLFDCLLAQEWQ